MENHSALATNTAYDVVGRYSQDEINGFSEPLLDFLVATLTPGRASSILDLMAGDGNLSLRVIRYCEAHEIPCPALTVFDQSRVQCAFARARLADELAKNPGTPRAEVRTSVLWGNAVTMTPDEPGQTIPSNAFDRVMLKSGNHEIPLDQQLELYQNILRVLRPGGLFVNLGFLFDDPSERDELREIARCKDQLAGMKSAVENRHFLTRQELYTRLEQSGFETIRCARAVQYRIRSSCVAKHYFAGAQLTEFHTLFRQAQMRAHTMRRHDRIRFEPDQTVMTCPGEITVAHKPS